MKQIIILLLLSSPLYGQYKITPKKILTWSTFAAGGTIWGMREAYHADPYIFEKKWGVDEYSFWGSKQWERKYVGNRYLTDGVPNKMKSQMFGNFGRDFWHSSGYTSGLFVIGGTFTIGNSKQKFTHKLIDMSIGSLVFLGFSKLTYNLLR